MAKIVYKTTLYELNQVTPTLKELKVRFEEPQEFKFKAGQFVMLQVPQEGSEKPAQRAYSIASSALNEREMVLLIKHVPGGLASEYVAQMKTGDTLHFTGPWGRCFFMEPPADQVLFICTGSGMSQHLAFLFAEATKHPSIQYRLLVGVGTEAEVYYVSVLEGLKKQLTNFSYEFVISRPGPTWKGRTGYVTHFLEEFRYKERDTHIYLCGINEMIKSAKHVLIEENHFPKERIVTENFG